MPQPVAFSTPTTLGEINAVSEIFSPRPGLFVAEAQNTGSFVGTCVIERRVPQISADWSTITRDGTPIVFGAAFCEILTEPTDAAQYRVRVLTYTSGTNTAYFQQ